MGRVKYRTIACVLVVCIVTFNLRNVYLPFYDTPRLGTHYYGDDGLLLVNPDGPHPIFELIQHAEEDWARKLDSASQTLDEAVAEYKRRYHRRPPLHFEKWWDYIVEHNVQLPDEYDDIHRDLEPFWGIDPLDLQKNREELEVQYDNVVVEKTDKSPQLQVVNRRLPPDSAERLTQITRDILVLLKDVEHSLPPFRAVFSPHDNPNVVSDYGVKSMALAAAANGSTLKRHELPMEQELGWVSACHPSSPARQTPVDFANYPERPSRKTFISDHRRAMDPCLHPSILRSHGQFLTYNRGPNPHNSLAPSFSLCSTMIHNDVRPAGPYGWIEDILPRSDDPPWEEKTDERMVWRGSNTGISHGVGGEWRYAQRDRLVSYVNDVTGTLDILRSPLNDSEPVGAPTPLRKAHVNPALFDIQFAGQPVACPVELCDSLHNFFDWRRPQKHSQAGRYKYAFDVDGNGWSGRFKRLITSNSLVFKTTIYPEWYMGRIVPWVHYVPIQLDLSDLHDAFIFFHGGPSGEGAHDDMARKIATAGRHWSKTFWRREDLTAHTFRLLLEYARVSSLDRDAMSYKED